MNYIELINRFWILNVANPFSSTQVHLYFLLLDRANRSHWQPEFVFTDTNLQESMGCSYGVLKRARAALITRGLIAFLPGGKDGRHKSCYKISGANSTEVMNNPINPNVNPNTNPNTNPITNPNISEGVYLYNKTKKEKTKQNKKNSFSNFNFSSFSGEEAIASSVKTGSSPRRAQNDALTPYPLSRGAAGGRGEIPGQARDNKKMSSPRCYSIDAGDFQ